MFEQNIIYNMKPQTRCFKNKYTPAEYVQCIVKKDNNLDYTWKDIDWASSMAKRGRSLSSQATIKFKDYNDGGDPFLDSRYILLENGTHMDYKNFLNRYFLLRKIQLANDYCQNNDFEKLYTEFDNSGIKFLNPKKYAHCPNF